MLFLCPPSSCGPGHPPSQPCSPCSPCSHARIRMARQQYHRSSAARAPGLPGWNLRNRQGPGRPAVAPWLLVLLVHCTRCFIPGHSNNSKSVCCRAVQIRHCYVRAGGQEGRSRSRSRSKTVGRTRLRGHPDTPPLPRPSTANAPSPLRTGMRECAPWLAASCLAGLLLASLPGCSSSAWPSPLAVTVAVSAPPHADDSH